MSWAPLDVAWRSLVLDEPLDGSAPPFCGPIPHEAWDYGVMSSPIEPGPDRVVRVSLTVHQGRAGVAMITPNGVRLLSDEQAIGPDDGLTQVLLPLSPTAESAAILLRNYGMEGQGGRVQVHEASIAPLTALTPKEKAAVLGAARQREFWADDPLWRTEWPADQVYETISLGNTCEAKFHLARALHAEIEPDHSAAAFRLMMLPPARSRDRYGWTLFDWQGTPFKALCQYLEHDFQGVFEREDLRAHPLGVLHRRLGTEHFHAFEAMLGRGEAYDEALIDRGYAQARAQFEALAEDFRQRLTRPGPFLYVLTCEDIPSEFQTRRLVDLLRARSPEHRFRLLYVGFEDEDSDLSALGSMVAKAWRPRPVEGVSVMTGWEGDYAAWQAALAPFRMTPPLSFG